LEESQFLSFQFDQVIQGRLSLIVDYKFVIPKVVAPFSKQGVIWAFGLEFIFS
jgi:hypothetical protein